MITHKLINQIDLTLLALVEPHYYMMVMLFFAMSTLCYFRFSVSLSHITSDESKTVVVNTKSRSIKLTYCGPLPPLQSPPPFVSETPDAGAYCGDCLSPLHPYYCENHQTEEPM